MEWTYNKEDLARLLCPAFNVKSVNWDAKKKQLVLEIEIPTTEERMKTLTAKMQQIKDAATTPETKKEPDNKSYA